MGGGSVAMLERGWGGRDRFDEGDSVTSLDKCWLVGRSHQNLFIVSVKPPSKKDYGVAATP